MKKGANPFLVIWTLAVAAATSAFVVYLTMRMKSIDLGYELGRAHGHVGRLREVKRVLELELSSHETPERVDLVARTLFGMSKPTPDRMVSAGPEPTVPDEAVEPDGPSPPPGRSAP